MKRYRLYILLQLAIALYKSTFIRMDSYLQFNDFYKDLFFLNSSQILQQIMWLLPFLVMLYFTSSMLYDNLNHFKTRYKNRKRYFRKMLILTLLLSAFNVLVMFILELVPIWILSVQRISVTLQLSSIIMIIEVVIGSLMIVLFSLLTNQFIFPFIAVCTGIFIGNYLHIEKLLPIANVYLYQTISPVVLIEGIVCFILLYKVYQTKDLI